MASEGERGRQVDVPAPGAPDALTDQEVAAELDLAPHPEGGWYKRIWTGGHVLAGTTERPATTAIQFLLPAVGATAWHRLRTSEEFWVWQAGAPMIVATGGDGPAPLAVQEHSVGPPGSAQGHFLVPAMTWQRAWSVGGRWSLVVCAVSPGFDFDDFEMTDH